VLLFFPENIPLHITDGVVVFPVPIISLAECPCIPSPEDLSAVHAHGVIRQSCTLPENIDTDLKKRALEKQV
jgi:hypothetical protein